MAVLRILCEHSEAFSAGVMETIKMTFLACMLGMAAGSVLGVLAYLRPRSIGIACRLGVLIISGIPFIVLLFWVHYPLQSMLRISLSPFQSTVIVLCLVNILVVSEIVRSGIKAIPSEFVDVARVSGLSSLETIWWIQLPLTLRTALPPILMAQVFVLHSTMLGSLVGAAEIFRVALRINATVLRPVEIFSALAIVFAAVSIPVNVLAFVLYNRYRRDFSEK